MKKRALLQSLALAAVLPHIGDNPVPALIHPQLLAELGDHGEDMAQQGGVLLRQRSRRRNVPFGDH